MDHHCRFIADLWKRFVADEEIDCRVNYGFTSKRKFGDSLKVHELNYENIPVIEESRDRIKACDQIKRRVICWRMGTATFTANPEEVNHDNGIYLLIPQDELKNFLLDPLTSSVYFRDWCLPLFRENSLPECLRCLSDLAHIDSQLEEDTAWLAGRLSGSSMAPPGDQDAEQSSHDQVVRLVHAKTPMRHVIKEYLISKVDDLPGSISSSKGRRTKCQNFVSALDRSKMKLFRQLEHNSFEKLQINWDMLEKIMEEAGGQSVFGSWSDWGCPFEFRSLQQKWEDVLFNDVKNEIDGLVALEVRPTVIALAETVCLEQLRCYVEPKVDRRQSLLEAYLLRHVADGKHEGSMSTLTVEYYQAHGYGRLLARGPAGQKLTREARKRIFGHLVDVDCACCRPRLLKLHLENLGLWNPELFPMLRLFCENYRQWREALAAYMNAEVDVAKTELIRIFYGGQPRSDIPWMRKLAAEVQTAANLVLKHPSSFRWTSMYLNRPNPEFSQLCAILSFQEAS